MTRTIGILPLGRATFDVPFAEEMLTQMMRALDETGHRIAGPRHLLFDAAATQEAMADLTAAGITDLLILQVTFTDAAAISEAAGAFPVPLMIWAVPEPRLGGRLRLNAFCGLNLAAHALGLRAREFSWLYAEPGGDTIVSDLVALLGGTRKAAAIPAMSSAGFASDDGSRIADSLKGRRIGRIGQHPDGFDTCRYDASAMERLAGVEIDTMELPALFDAARTVPPDAAASLRSQSEAVLSGLDQVESTQLDKSLRLKVALDDLRSERRYDAFAIRCWPETFTEYGGAVCGPVSMLGEARVPCACEADVYGALTSLMLQAAADAPVFLVDLVDIDVTDGTGVVWHCGQAPVSMAKPGATPRATIHTNRKMPLLFEFTLKPGRVTFARISQALGETKMVIASGEMLDAPMAFTGTSGVVRFDSPARDVLDGIIGSGIEHHTAIAYGDHKDRLRGVAAALDIPILEL